MPIAASISLKLSSLPLRPSTLSCLTRRGFTSTEDIEVSKRDGGISNLAAELGVQLAEAASFVREVETAMKNCGASDAIVDKGSSPVRDYHFNTNAMITESSTAASLILAQSSSSLSHGRHIVTFCQSIDSLLGGGFARSELTEVAGLPGVGKTQLAMQICVDSRLPRAYGGVEGEAVYIDSEGSFSPERCFDMAKALVDHVHTSSNRRKRSNNSKRSTENKISHVPDWFHTENILDGIHVFRVHDEAAQTACINALPKFLKEREQNGLPIRVIVIDSIAFHYRTSGPNVNYNNRTKCLTSIAAYLSDLATNFDLAVIAINHMTTKIGKGNNNNNNTEIGETRLVPALGESWAHSTTTRIILDFYKGTESVKNRESVRCCKLVKSPHKPSGSALFTVTEHGIRGLQQNSNNDSNTSSKRHRHQ